MSTNGLQRLHRRLLPENAEIGYTPYLWLVYLLFLLPGLYFKGWQPLSVWLSVLSVVVFLPLYFRSFWLYGRNALMFNCVLIAAIGAALLPINSSASVYFIYAAAGVAFINNTRKALLFMLALALWLVAETLLLGYPSIAIVVPAMMVIMIGCANLFHAAMVQKNARLQSSQDEVSRLAAVAERERISRDLHDLLGHSLSLITLKAELAGKLLRRNDTQRATQEVNDLERISREALSEVRQAVTGYRQANLQDELRHARGALHAADIELELQGAVHDLPRAHDNALAMCVREGVTNVIRHAGANRCRIVLAHLGNKIHLSIGDNGKRAADMNKAPIEMGSGLSGMRDRVVALEGSLKIQQQDGLLLEIELPLSEQQSEQGVDEPGMDHAA